MTKLILTPHSSQYSVRRGQSAVAGRSAVGLRVRSNAIDAAHSVSVSWNVDSFEAEYLTAFYEDVSNQGAVRFEIDLVLEGTLRTSTARFVPGSFTLDNPRGTTIVVSAELVIDEDIDGRIAGLILVDLVNEGYTEGSIPQLLTSLDLTDLESISTTINMQGDAWRNPQ